MSDDDLIRRGDALKVVSVYGTVVSQTAAIAALPAVTRDARYNQGYADCLNSGGVAEALREAADMIDKRHRGNLPDHIKSEDGNAIRDMIEAKAWKGPGEKPHAYSPDYMAMGDCRICGHTRDAHG